VYNLDIIIPSRTQEKQVQFLLQAIDGIANQSVLSKFKIRIIIGIDKEESLIIDEIHNIQFEILITNSTGHSQAEALNSAIRKINADYVAFLEDDDTWLPNFLELTEKLIEDQVEFISSTQTEIDENNIILRTNDFPTPSGWFMTSQLLDKIGPFNETFRFHLDNEWLGRLGDSNAPRGHLVEITAPVELKYTNQVRPWLSNVVTLGGNNSRLFRHNLPYPQVRRLVHSGSGMANIAANSALSEISNLEVERLISMYGRVPW
jgi:glycosyltransferase involved in cell wall biosynthesis